MFRIPTVTTLMYYSLLLYYVFFPAAAQLYAQAQWACRIPLLSWVPGCPSIRSNFTVWAALPRLLDVQDKGLQEVASTTQSHSHVMLDLTEARIAAVDLALVVRASDLDYHDQLAGLISQYADDSLELTRSLQLLTAKIGAGFDL